MRRTFVILAIALQVVILAVMALEREYIVRYGTEVYLRTAPIDPRDIFRGDYVRLSYEISNISLRQAQGSLADKKMEKPKGSKVYAVIIPGEDGIAGLQHITNTRPDDGLFVKGRLSYPWRPKTTNNNALSIKYGIEAYFVEQGKGLEMENKRGSRTGIQIPLEMKVAIGTNGTPVIKGHRWSKLGMGLKVLRQGRQQNQKDEPISGRLEITLQNVSKEDLAIVDLPDVCSFALEPVNQVDELLPLANDFCRDLPVYTDQVIVLSPDESKTWEIDFAEPRWQVIHKDQTVEIGSLPWNNRFRLVYRPPSHEESTHLADKELIWHGYLPSRAFHGRGNVD
ncbi:MAG: GDYXXLXY domain-containing protein [Proteobacteria bacterium]|nr:GDYXXLXY domain-containing protein [Pseudomonadota bacterium]